MATLGGYAVRIARARLFATVSPFGCPAFGCPAFGYRTASTFVGALALLACRRSGTFFGGGILRARTADRDQNHAQRQQT
jgi:hypothetical protein